MPNINRIRVNNVKYNFGTQGYDDFSMRMYGKNTLYDLANGGGKSVLMLLLLQNLIPNCTLDEKQPIEKLFRNGGGNTTIHSLVEWKLDDKDIKEGFRYMTTGFCARKAKDADASEDGQMSLTGEDVSATSITSGEGATTGNTASKGLGKDSASIEYFNYCIFYRDYNENDIVNLPLQNSKERITYAGLKNYLKDLARKNLNLTAKMRHMARKTTREKLLSYLSAQALRAGSPEFEIPMDRQQLADFLAVERSAMSTALGKLRDEGILEFRKNHFHLLQPQEQDD